MPRPITVLVNWTRSGALSMASFAQDVSDDMTDNANFPTPAVSPKDLATASQNVVQTYGKRKNGTPAKIAAETAVDNLDTLLHQQAEYINGLVLGTDTADAVIASAGYTSTKPTGTPGVIPGTPPPPELSTEDGGILHLHLKNAVKGAIDYCWIIFLDVVVNITIIDNRLIIPSGANIIIIPSGTTTETVTGLTPNTKVSVMVLSQNHAGKSSWSPMITKVIQ